MRILYGVQGTGNGHLTRARVLAPALAQAGIEVDYLFSGRPRERFFDMDPFGDFACYQGLTFTTKGGKIRPVATALNNSLLRFWRDTRALNLNGYDLVLNDFEPISAWASKLQNVPSIGISHQNAFLQQVPMIGDSMLTRAITKYFAPNTVAIGCHWHHFGCQLLPPFIESYPLQSSNDEHVLVYLPFEEPAAIVSLLAQLPQQRFEVFHSVDAPTLPAANIRWHALSRTQFSECLASCQGVICSAGFELGSEALSLGKKLLLKPLQGQYEQLSNALALELLGVATVVRELSPMSIKQWLLQEGYEPIGYPMMAELFVEWLLRGDWHDVDRLCQTAWQHARLPETWNHKWATAY